MNPSKAPKVTSSALLNKFALEVQTKASLNHSVMVIPLVLKATHLFLVYPGTHPQ